MEKVKNKHHLMSDGTVDIRKKFGFKKTALFITLLLALSFTGIWFALRDSMGALDYLSQISTETYLIFIAIILFYFVAEGLQLTLLTRLFKKDYTLWQGIKLRAIGLFFSAITPMAAGGQFAQVFVLKRQGVDKTKGAAILLTNFIVIQLSLSLLSSVTILSRIGHYRNIMDTSYLLWAGVLGMTFTILILAVLILCAASERFQNKFVKIFIKLLSIFQKDEKKLEKRKQKFLNSMSDFRSAGKIITKHKWVLVATLLLYTSTSVTNSLGAYVVGKDLGIAYTFANAYDVVTLTLFQSMVNGMIPTPGGSGTSEIIYHKLFLDFLKGTLTGELPSNIDEKIGAQMIIWRSFTFIIPMFTGLMVYVLSRDGLRKSKQKT